MGNKKSFIDETFGDESRDPFPKKTKNTLKEEFEKLNPKVTADEMTKFVNSPDQLPKHRLEYVFSEILDDMGVAKMFFNEVKKRANKENGKM